MKKSHNKKTFRKRLKKHRKKLIPKQPNRNSSEKTHLETHLGANAQTPCTMQTPLHTHTWKQWLCERRPILAMQEQQPRCPRVSYYQPDGLYNGSTKPKPVRGRHIAAFCICVSQQGRRAARAWHHGPHNTTTLYGATYPSCVMRGRTA